MMGSPPENIWKKWELRYVYDTDIWDLYLKGYKLNEKFWLGMNSYYQNNSLIDLIKNCLNFDDEMRFTSDQILSHEFFKDITAYE